MTRPARATALHDGVAALLERATELAARRPSPPWLQRLRTAGVSGSERLGFPSTNDEEWRFTNLAPLTRSAFALSPDEVSLAERTAALELEARLGPLGLSSPEPRIVFVNGRLLRRSPGGLTAAILFECLKNVLATSPERVERALVAGAAARDEFFGSLGDAFLDEGVVLQVPAGAHLEEPLFILHVSTSPGSTVPPRMVHTRNLFTFEENSSATVVEAYLGANGPSFTNARTDVTLAKGARLHHVKLQLEGPETFHVGQLAVAHAAGAHATSHVFSFGGKLVRNEIAMTLRGEGSSTELNGLFCAASGQHVDCHTLI
ncbi:MAG TPA: SufD family Fe-S cluster assembly protein, partial [Thermoanaerobaculia bacterium]